MKKPSPTKDEIALMRPFAGLTVERIHVPTGGGEHGLEASFRQVQACDHPELVAPRLTLQQIL